MMNRTLLIAVCAVVMCAGLCRAEESTPGAEPHAPKIDKVSALADAIAKKHPEVRFCHKDDNYIHVDSFGGFNVGCGIPDDDYRDLLSDMDVSAPFYVLSYKSASGSVDYELVYGPLVPKDAEDLESLQKAGAVFTYDDVRKAVKLAIDVSWQNARNRSYAAETKAVEKLKEKLFGGKLRGFDAELDNPYSRP